MHEFKSWKKEKRAARLYRIMSDLESGTPRQLLFLELAKEADSQAELWLYELKKSGIQVPATHAPDLTATLLAWLMQKLGPRKIKPLLALVKLRGLSVYSSPPMPISFDGMDANHPGAASSGLRTVLIGVNDGLASIACLVMGVAGAYSESAVILLVGVAGLLAGAVSMAAGEYVSVRAQREMYDYHASLKGDEPAHFPAAEAAELALIYRARGLTEKDAVALARRMIMDPETGQENPVREEPAYNPEEPGTPWIAALASFFAFVAGGVVPILPYLLDARRHPLLISIVLAALSLFCIGAALATFTTRNALWGGLRTLLICGTAGALAYLVGDFLGARID